MSTSKLHLLFGALVALNALDGFCTLRTREFIKLRALQTECNHVNTKTATRVMGGKTAKMAHFPSFMILSMRVLQGDHVLERDCGAVIIDKQYLLTAASCLMLPEIQKIVSGTAWRTNKRPEDRKNFVGRGYAMKAFCVPATYKKDSKNDFYHDDFAVVKLSREIEFSKKAQPICLRSEPCKDCPNSYSVPGFGKTVDYKSEKGKVSFNGDLLRYVRLEDNPCEKPFNKDEFMCLSSPEHSGKTSATCEGDEGGPVISTQDGKQFLKGIIINQLDNTCDPYRSRYTHAIKLDHRIEMIKALVDECVKIDISSQFVKVR